MSTCFENQHRKSGPFIRTDVRHLSDETSKIGISPVKNVVWHNLIKIEFTVVVTICETSLLTITQRHGALKTRFYTVMCDKGRKEEEEKRMFLCYFSAQVLDYSM